MAQEGSEAGTHSGRPLVSIIIPVFNQWALTWKCLLALARNSAQVSHEIIVVDDASSDETADALPLLEGIRHHRNPLNSGFARSCNQGARLARGKYLLFLNNDTEVHPGWLPPMVDILERRPDVAVVGNKLLFPDGTIQHGGVVFSYAGPIPVMPFHLDYRQPANARDEILDLSAVTAACMLIRPEVFSRLGGFDEGYRNGYEDVDLCLKVKEAGHRILYTPHSVVTHHESMSDGRFHAGCANDERLAETWVGRFDAFEFDFRRLARHAPEDPERPGVTVVVVVRDNLLTVAPCLENVRFNIGPQDRLVIVDDASRPATRKYIDFFLESYPGLGHCLRLTEPVGFTAAVAAALTGTDPGRPFAAVLPANVKVVTGWLDRLVRHLRADDTLGVVSPQEGDPFQLSPKDRLFPPEEPDPVAAQPPLARAGAAPEAIIPPSLCLAGPRALLASLASEEADVLHGLVPDALAQALRARGKRLGAAHDARVYRFEETAIDAGQRALRMDYLFQQARWLEGGVLGAGRQLSVVVTAEAVDLAVLRACLTAVLEHTPAPFQLVVVDDAGAPEIGHYLRTVQVAGVAVTLIRNRQREGTAFARNQGLAAASGKHIAVLDGHLVVSRGWSDRLLAALASDTTLAAVGPVTNHGAGLQANPAGMMLGLSGAPALAQLPRYAEQVALDSRGELRFTERLAGSALLFARSLLDRIGGLDTAFVRPASAELDFSERARRGGHRLAVACDVYVHEQRARAPVHALERRLAEEQDRDLVASRAADPEVQRLAQRVPVEHVQLFHPRAPALDLGLPRDLTRLLFIPDMLGTAWRDVIRVFVRTFTAADRVALCLRIEPPSEPRVSEAFAKVTALLEELGITPDRAPEIVFEASALPAASRAGLYTAASAYISCPGPRDQVWRREASACGLTIIETNAEQLSRLLRAAA
jgi:GT2 family glycosyltransferase